MLWRRAKRAGKRLCCELGMSPLCKWIHLVQGGLETGRWMLTGFYTGDVLPAEESNGVQQEEDAGKVKSGRRKANARGNGPSTRTCWVVSVKQVGRLYIGQYQI